MEQDFQEIRHDIVLVIWDDAVTDDPTWKSVDDALDWSEDLKSQVYTVGFLLNDEEHYVLLAQSIMPLIEHAGDRDTNANGIFRIPKSAISETKILVKAENI